MSTTKLVEELKRLTNPERLAVIEAATRLIREDLTSEQVQARADLEKRLQTAALAVKDLYQPGGELTEWTDLDAESTDLERNKKKVAMFLSKYK